MEFILDELYEQGRIYILKIYGTDNSAYISPCTGRVLWEYIIPEGQRSAWRSGWYVFTTLEEFEQLDMTGAALYFGKDVIAAAKYMTD